jgi:hypothetical protein
MKVIYIYFWTSRGVFARSLRGGKGRREGTAAYPEKGKQC